METSIDVWDATPDHVSQLIELGKTYYAADHPAVTEKYLTWFYLNNPAGPAKLVVAHEASMWIGLIVLIPVLLQCSGRTQRACFAVNVLTHPKHRGKNLFVKMIDRAKERLALENIWLLGHPNGNALPGWRRKKMQFEQPLKLHMAKLWLPFSGIKITRVQGIEQLRSLPGEFWVAADVRDDVHPCCSPEFISWRFLDAPHRRYRVSAIYRGEALLGLRVTRKFKGPIELLVDYLGPLDRLGTVVGSVTRPTLLMHSGLGLSKESIQNGSWKLPLKRVFPFFSTRWSAEDSPLDMSGITLAASDF